MTILKFSNNATTTLAAPLTNSATTCLLAAGTGSLFPTLSAGEAFTLSFFDAGTRLVTEIVLCTARSGDSCTIVRGQEGTSAVPWLAGDIAVNNDTAGTQRAFTQAAALASTTEGLGSDLIPEASKRLANVTAARALTAATTVSVIFISGTDGGWFRRDPSDTTSAEDGGSYCGTIIRDTVYATLGVWKRSFPGTYLLPEWYGAQGDGVTDDHTFFNNAILASLLRGCVPIMCRAVTYKWAGTVYGNGSGIAGYNQVPIIGIAGNSNTVTTILCSGLGAGVPALKYKGLNSDELYFSISNLKFSGDTNTICIELSNVSKVDVVKCQFLNCAEGICFHNEDAGAYTEFCRAVGCKFDSTCVLPIHYKKTSGDPSFHGSGLADACLIVRSNTNPAIVIDSGCQPYNAPLHLQIFSGFATTLIKNNSSAAITYYGQITSEATNLTLATGGIILFTGGQTHNNEGVAGGTLVQCQNAINTSNGSQVALGARRASKQNLTTGANTLICPNPLAIQTRITTVTLGGTGYYYRYTFVVTPNGTGGAGQAVALATFAINNTAAYGAPTITVDSGGYLVLTNASYPASGVIAYYEDTGIVSYHTGSPYYPTV
jgi:hypothetical protein